MLVGQSIQLRINFSFIEIISKHVLHVLTVLNDPYLCKSISTGLNGRRQDCLPLKIRIYLIPFYCDPVSFEIIVKINLTYIFLLCYLCVIMQHNRMITKKMYALHTEFYVVSLFYADHCVQLKTIFDKMIFLRLKYQQQMLIGLKWHLRCIKNSIFLNIF